ncbi:MAG: hypothetical protein ACOYN4_15325 [Bacteroidales bacterium]
MGLNDNTEHDFNGNIQGNYHYYKHYDYQNAFSRRQQYLAEKLLCHKLRTFVIIKTVVGVVAILAIVPILIGAILLLT